MKINIVAVGKIKEKYFADAVAEYEKRLSRFCSFKITEVSEAPPSKSAAEQSVDESSRLLAHKKGYTVGFDIKGEEFSSERLAEFFDVKTASGISEFTFFIGGSNGLGAELKSQADLLISFGKPTFPHQLFRVMAIEQIYRALTINAGLPYHK